MLPPSGTIFSRSPVAAVPLSDATRHTVASYDRRARRYERRWAAYLRHTHQRFLEEINIGEGDRLLDLSAGTGLLAEELLASDIPLGSLTLNEPSRSMLDHARRRLPDSDILSYTSFPAEDFPWERQRFEAVLSLNALHVYPRQTDILRGIHRALPEGGRLHILDWDRSGWFRPVNTLIRLTQRERINTRSLAETREMLREAGFKVSGGRSWRFRWWKLFYVEGVRGG